MEVPGMDEAKKAEGHMSSAAAFVEGGIQEACDDACSICLEGFSDNDPSTVTTCKHEFHLQCVLEWCQRSSKCPMCWQNITLKDSTSQELLEAVERERSFRLNPSRSTVRFHHPTFGNVEVEHVPVGVDDAELEERIIQHLTAATAVGRNHHISRRESGRHRQSSRGLAGTGNNSSMSHLLANNEGADYLPSSVQNNQISASSSHSLGRAITSRRISNDNSQSSLPNQDGAGPSELQSFSDTWKSRFSSLSMQYKESISKSTKEWKEKLFSRSSSMTGIGSEVRREVNAGIATVSQMMEQLKTRDNERAGHEPVQSNAVGSSVAGRSSNKTDTPGDGSMNGNNSTSSAASSLSV